MSSEMREVDFWTTVPVFWRVLLFSTTLGSRELGAKINFETQLERDINLVLVFYWILESKMIRNSIQNRLKVVVNTQFFSSHFLCVQCSGLSRSDPPQNDVQGGGYEGTKGGSLTLSHASQAPFHGVGGYIYIYIYIHIYIYIYMLTYQLLTLPPSRTKA